MTLDELRASLSKMGVLGVTQDAQDVYLKVEGKEPALIQRALLSYIPTKNAWVILLKVDE